MSTETITIPIDLKREYTAEEYELLEDDGNRYELIEGKLVMSPAPSKKHAEISDELLTEIKNFLKANPGIARFGHMQALILARNLMARIMCQSRI